MAQTKLEHMVDPQVLADMINAELENALRFTPLASVDRTLEGRPGSTVTVPKFKYIGDATDVAEGVAIDTELLETSTEDFTIKKAAKGVEITDEAIMSGFGDPVGEAGNQLLMSIANKVDNDILDSFKTAVLYTNDTKFDLDTVSDSLDNFSDEDDQELVLIMNPKDASKLRKAVAQNWERASELGDRVIMQGVYGAVLGAQVYRSNKLEEGEAYFIKPNAGRVYLKRDVEMEDDRDILKKSTVMTADQHYGAHLYDDSRVIRVYSDAAEPTATVSSVENTGFDLALDPAVDGLEVDDFVLLDSDGDEVTIDDVSTSDSGETYSIEATLSSSVYTIRVKDQPGYIMPDAKDVDNS